MMLDTMFQHLGTVQCALFMWLSLRKLYLIKETTPYFLFTKQHIFVRNQFGDLFLKYKQYFRISWWCFWRFLKMFLLLKSFYICYYFVVWDHWRFYEDFIHVTCAPRSLCFQKKHIFQMDNFICEIYFQKKFWKIYLWRIFVSIYFWKEYLIQIYVWPEVRFNCANIFLEGMLEIMRRIFDSNICCCWWLYKEDSYPSFIHQFNVIESSLLGFYC